MTLQNIRIKKISALLSLVVLIMFSGCIKDDIIEDFVEPVIRITNPVEKLEIGSTYEFKAIYINNVGINEDETINWKSSDERIISINQTGLASTLKVGSAFITAYLASNSSVNAGLTIAVDSNTVISMPQMRTGTLRTTSSYALSGDFSIQEVGNDVVLSLENNYNASTALPGLYVYLTNNPNTISGALEIGKVQVFNGSHSYNVSGVGAYDYQYVLYYCKPFNVKVGDGEFIN